ncbi:hypothetical protein KC325_g19 [Hortaea werneckii]|nr:hypothetical protein KC325_g19 [Hortaea werneckii]
MWQLHPPLIREPLASDAACPFAGLSVFVSVGPLEATDCQRRFPDDPRSQALVDPTNQVINESVRPWKPGQKESEVRSNNGRIYNTRSPGR